MTDDQSMLSRFDAGDTDDVDLSIDDSDGYDYEGRERARVYAEQVTTDGWELQHVAEDKIWWGHPDPDRAKLYKIEKNAGGWSGYRAGNVIGTPSNVDDLQDALDAAGEWMADHPLDVAEDGGETA